MSGTGTLVLALGAFLGSIAVPFVVSAQDPGRVPDPPAMSGSTPPPFDPDHSHAPLAVAVRVNGPVDIDGRLDEAVWREAPPVTDFWQFEPDEGIAVSEPTEVRFLYDDDALYVGAWLWDRDGNIPTRLGRRDVAMSDTDLFAVHLDTYHDHRTSYRFAINPSGARRDQASSGGGSLAAGDGSWNPVWEAETTRDARGWYVEMRIPFSQLRFSQEAEQTWGLQLERKLRPVQENTVWAYTPRSEVQGQGRFGHLTGIRGVPPGRVLEVMPYASARASYLKRPTASPGGLEDPFWDASQFESQSGLDLKYRVTSNLTLDATLNPDFGQVEADPAVINLTAFETRFDERRPFFIEGAEIFDFGDRTTELFYSRRLGRTPQGPTPDGAVHLSAPGSTTILGAGKLTGKTVSGWSLGVLTALTGRERVDWIDEAAAMARTEVEPPTIYAVARARREMSDGRTAIGVFATMVRRDLGGSPLDDRLHDRALTGGLDFAHEFGSRTWAFGTQISGSRVTGSEAAMLRTQRSSARYFQRPDAERARLDPTATLLDGYSARASLEKRAGFWRFGGVLSAVSPGHEINDIGFQSLADRIEVSGTVGMEQVRRGSHLLNWSLRANPTLAWNYSGDPIGAALNLSGAAQLPNYTRLGLRLTLTPDRLNGRLTRGGPMGQDPASYEATATLTTDTRTRLTGQAEVGFLTDADGGWERATSVTAGYRAASTVDFSVEPSLVQRRSTAQFVGSVADPTAVSTYGRRYVFADLHQTTLSVDLRANVTLSPRTSIELFAQPFLSSGDYGGLKELSAPRGRTYFRYGEHVGGIAEVDGGRGYEIDPDGTGPASPFTLNNGDFNVRSLLTNLVLRWEWRPGSTLFAVWQHARSHTATPETTAPGAPLPGRFRLGSDADELFGLPADNILQLKVSFWLNPL